MLTRGGRKQGADEQTLHDDEGGAGLLQKAENGEGDDDAEGEGAGLLPMDPEKTLALVACPVAILLYRFAVLVVIFIFASVCKFANVAACV